VLGLLFIYAISRLHLFSWLLFPALCLAAFWLASVGGLAQLRENFARRLQVMELEEFSAATATAAAALRAGKGPLGKVGRRVRRVR